MWIRTDDSTALSPDAPSVRTGQRELEDRPSANAYVDLCRSGSAADIHDMDGSRNVLSASSVREHTANAEDSALGMGGSRCADGNQSLEDTHLDRDGPSGESCTLAVNVMSAMILGRESRGGSLSVFTDNIDALYSMAMEHSISVPSKPNADNLRSLILAHVLLGDCFGTHRVHGVHHSDEAYQSSQCARLACSYASGKSLSLDCLRFVQSYSSRVAHLPADRLFTIVRSIGYKGTSVRSRSVSFLDGFVERIEQLLTFLDVVKSLPAPYILSLARAHRIPTSKSDSLKDVKSKVQEHFKEGVCGLAPPVHEPETVINDSAIDRVRSKWMDDYLLSMDVLVGRMGHRACRRLIVAHGLEGDTASHRSCRKIIRAYIMKLRKGKRQEEYIRERAAERRDEQAAEVDDFNRRVTAVQSEWPKVVNNNLKEKLLRDFMMETESDSLRTCTCAICSESQPIRDVRSVSPSDYDLSCLKPLMPISEPDVNVQSVWPGTSIPLPYCDGPLSGLMIDTHGVEISDTGYCMLSVCSHCLKDIKHGVVPKFSLANGMFLSDIPAELSDLTIIEESMIALCRSKCYIFQLKEDRSENESGYLQMGMKGHVIVYPQRPSHIATILPPSIERLRPLYVFYSWVLRSLRMHGFVTT